MCGECVSEYLEKKGEKNLMAAALGGFNVSNNSTFWWLKKYGVFLFLQPFIFNRWLNVQ